MFVFEPQLSTYFQHDQELGFRVKPYGPKTTGTYRVLFVGDSFGWTGGIDGNDTALLERSFEVHFGRHVVDVVNTGYPMTQTPDQLVVWASQRIAVIREMFHRIPPTECQRPRTWPWQVRK